jgi:hypothetical protein
MLSPFAGTGASYGGHRTVLLGRKHMSNRMANPTTTTGARSLLRTSALAVGVVFLLVGVLGFIPGVTTNYDDMTFAGHMSDAKLLDLFQVSVLHNIVHLLFGIAGIALSRRADTAFTYLVGGGVIYLVLWVYGLVVDKGTEANFVPVNNADDWLHLVLGLGMIALGLIGRNRDRKTTRSTL